jgi:hypothetical protein
MYLNVFTDAYICFNYQCEQQFSSERKLLSLSSEFNIILKTWSDIVSDGRDYFAGLKVTKRNKATVLLTLTLLQTPTLTLILTLILT